MQIVDGMFVYAASDLNDYLECEHLVGLSQDVALERRARPEPGAATALIARKGDEHERRFFDELGARYGVGVVAFDSHVERTCSGLLAAERRTVKAMAAGARIIYQASFFDGEFFGRTDFLRRVDVPSARWAWSYEVVDTKLALSVKPYFLIQLCNYSEHVARIQGRPPELSYIVAGTGIEHPFRIEEYAAYYRHLKATFLASARTSRTTYPSECSHCEICTWKTACEQRRDDDDHLSLVAGIRREQIVRLTDAGISTLARLATAREDERPRGMSAVSFANLRAQAAEQHKGRVAVASGSAGQRYFYSFRSAAQTALAKLPPPAEGDVFFDMEGDPLYEPGRGLEYLFGAYLPDDNEYREFWAREPAAERVAFEAFVDFLSARLAKFPDLHVYHYASYETTALKRLMGQFGSREDEIDAFLRRGLFIDLFPLVRQSLWISQPSYSIKKLEAFYGMKRRTVTQRGDDSILMFETWRERQDPAILDDIRAYNEDDCRSTFSLREWLVRLRCELAATLIEPLPWRAKPGADAAQDEPSAPQRSELEVRLLDGLAAPSSLAELRAADESLRARWLLGNLLRYYRREHKPEWWTYFDRCVHPEELEEHDRYAIGGLRLRAEIEPYKVSERDRTLVYTYEFPEQEFYLRGDPHSPSRKKAGTLVALDERTRTLQIKLSGKGDPAELRALIPGPPIPDKAKRVALETLAAAYLDGTLEDRFRATADILFARVPRLTDRTPGSDLQPARVTEESVSATIASLDASYLFVQGPPGSGKSTAGAWAIVDLLAAGKRVGIVANGHKALHGLLRKIEETAHDRDFRFRGRHKASDRTEGSTYEAFPAWPMVESVFKGDDLAAECALVSGTTFAWADEKLTRAFDYLFVDEAGQVPLADALVVSQAAKNVVLLGDPQQLPHVSQGSHPLGTDRSVLEHLLGDAATVPKERGIFLDVSYRMHPTIGRFISRAMYEGRLETDRANAENRIGSAGLWGSGLRYLPTQHTGNSRSSLEEAQRIVDEVRELLTGSVVIRKDPERALEPDDILVVTPYNLQRKRISRAFAEAGIEGVGVGTVDKFQGQQAAVVFISMATSSDEDLPRDMTFLFDRKRFNVAVSRAQCLTALVCSPALLETRARTPEQMSLVNLLCAFAEQARG